jgi:hypothetical protein
MLHNDLEAPITGQTGTRIRRRAAPCSAVCGPFDYFEIRVSIFEIRVSTNLKVIERTTCCAARCRAAADLIPDKLIYRHSGEI